MAYILEFGSIPENDNDSYHGVCVCHKCDNPKCCNPRHLWLGTNADNMSDMSIKERTHTTKLTAAQIYEIKKLNGKMTHKEIAKKFGVSAPLISYIMNGKRWKHIA